MTTLPVAVATSSVLIPRPKKPPDPMPLVKLDKAGEAGKEIAQRGRPEGSEKEYPAEIAGNKWRSRRNEGPMSWAGLFRRTRIEDDWGHSRKMTEKFAKIQEGARGRIFIEDEDLEMARRDCKWLIYGGLLEGVLSGGPWFFRGQALSLILWKEKFQPMLEDISMIPIWVQLPGLPFEFLHKNILPQIAVVIGQPMKYDDYTMAGTRRKFARICVMVDIKKPLEQGIWIETKRGKFFQSIAYENVPVICYACGRIGHREESCLAMKEKKDNGVSEDMDTSEKDRAVDKADEALMGPWIQVQKRGRRFGRGSMRTDVPRSNAFKILDNPTYEENKGENAGGNDSNSRDMDGNSGKAEKGMETRGKTHDSKKQIPNSGGEVANNELKKLAGGNSRTENYKGKQVDKEEMEIEIISKYKGKEKMVFETIERGEPNAAKIRKEEEQNKSNKALEELSEKISSSFTKILNNEFAREDFLEVDHDPELSRSMDMTSQKI
ncbi:hypothetical protein Cni_G05067 [Canna indica]|uniref:CCHC-type domain-containing protein n=1 Tax=Canna indica TaxID=4628 RepID=A0AAQ3Q2U8_9LILI|nr:hypothetical protein Cni_G05067 [Canna indica]